MRDDETLEEIVEEKEEAAREIEETVVEEEESYGDQLAEHYELIDEILKKWADELDGREFGNWVFAGYDPMPGTLVFFHKYDHRDYTISATPYFDGFKGIPISIDYYGNEQLEKELRTIEDEYPASASEYWELVTEELEDIKWRE